MTGPQITSSFQPGAPAPAAGGWPKTDADQLPVPGGRKFGEVPNGEIARLLIAADVPGIDHAMGRGEIAEAYAKHLRCIADAAGAAAVNAWLAQRSGAGA